MEPSGDAYHALALYDKLEQKVMPCFTRIASASLRSCQAIALNGGFFNTQRMMPQYLHNSYRLVGEYVRRG